jgi:hypothetical protein
MSQREAECFGGRKREERDWFGLVSFGFFLILLGVMFLVIPNFFSHVEKFITSFNQTEQIYPNVYLPLPTGDNTEVYRAIMYFCFTFGIFQIVILILRFAIKSSVDKKAGTLGRIIFWLGAGIFANMLVTGGNKNWFLFLAGLIVSIGLSIMVNSLAKIFSRSV